MSQLCEEITGLSRHHDPKLNKGTAFTQEERDAYGLRGLLPPRVFTLDEQVERVLGNLRRKPNDLEKYIFLMALQDRNETLFYRTLVSHLTELMPIVYTPTVGQACQEYGHIFRRSRGLYISISDMGHVAEILDNWPEDDVRVIVVTDGERILGLGDLGANGMGIPVGKLALYTGCAGVPPWQCLPITLDVGTNNPALLDDPMYIGLQQRRAPRDQYDALIEEFMQAVQARFPDAMVQLEDFGNANAFRLLEAYRERLSLFNDDIQGTGAVGLAGLYSALRISGQQMRDQQVVFLGAGEAAVGIAHMIVAAMVQDGLTHEEALRRCWFVDSRGLVVASRTDLNAHKREFAHEHEFAPDLLSAVEALRPTAIIGVAGQASMFTQPVLEAMARFNERPVVFALSNPTSKQECTAEEAYTWTEGRAIFASGSPSAPVVYQGKTIVPGQGNNSYIFPAVGLAVVACKIARVTDDLFLAAAQALAQQVADTDIEQGRIYPPLSQVRSVSHVIATAVAEMAYAHGLAKLPRPADLDSYLRSYMYEPEY